jgi:hypothetical protein
MRWFRSSYLPSAVSSRGYFVVVGVRLQFRRQNEVALRGLMAEVVGNKEAALDMTQSASAGIFEAGHADPSWLKHSIWDSQLPYVVQLFDGGTRLMVRYAYSLLDAVPAMIIPEGSRPPGSSRYARGGWVDTHLIKVQTAFRDADQALDNLSNRLASETRAQRVKRLLFEAWK